MERRGGRLIQHLELLATSSPHRSSDPHHHRFYSKLAPLATVASPRTGPLVPSLLPTTCPLAAASAPCVMPDATTEEKVMAARGGGRETRLQGEEASHSLRHPEVASTGSSIPLLSSRLRRQHFFFPLLHHHGIKLSKIGCFPLVTVEQGVRDSPSWLCGEEVIKPIQSVTWDVIRDFMINIMLPSIRAKWPI